MRHSGIVSKYRLGREHPRFVASHRISVCFHDREGGQTYGELTNISAYGACIVITSKHFPPGTQLLLRVFFPEEPDSFVSEAEIVWSRDRKTGANVAHGVRFVMLEEEQRQRLEAILTRPGFKLESSTGLEEQTALDAMMLDLTPDLDRLGQSHKQKLG